MVGEKKDTAAREREHLLRRERARLRMTRIVARWHASPLYRFSLAFRETVMMTNLRAFSVLLTPLGLVTLFRALILPLLTDDFPLLLSEGIAGAVVLLLSLLFFTYNAPLAKVLTEDTLLSRLFFDVLPLPRPYLSARRGLPIWLAVPVGLALGALTFLVSPISILAAPAILCFLALTLVSPEFGLILLAILFPLTALLPDPILPLTVTILLSLFSYLLKLLRGKRRLSFALTDLPVLLLALLLILSCLFAHEGAQVRLSDGANAAILLLGGYLLASNLLDTRRTLLQFTRGLLLGGAILGIAGIFCTAVELTAPEEPSAALLTLLGSMQTITGNSTGAVAVLLLLFPLLPVILGEARFSRRASFSVALLLGTALVLTLSPLTYLALLLSLILFAVIVRRRSPIVLVLLFGILPNFLIALPSAWTDALSSISFLGIGDLLRGSFEAQDAAITILLRHPFGVGLAYVDTGNLYLQLLTVAGIPALFLLLLLLLSIADCSTRSAACLREPHLRRLTAGVQSGVFALLVFGILVAPLSDFRVLFVFAMLLGLLVAIRRAIHESGEGPLPVAHKELSAATAAVEVRLSRRRERS